MTDELNDIDTLMAQDPLSLSTQDLDRIIAYQRKMRVQREAGVRTRKPKDSAPTRLNVDALLAKPIIGGGGIKRRF